MSAVDLFNFQGQDVRALGTPDQPWFVAGDICAALGLSNPTVAVGNLDEDEKGLRIVETLGGPQRVAVINESGLYSLVLRSRKPAAKAFKRWITHEVLPAIRKTGGYSVASTPAATPGATVDITALDRRALALMVIEAEDARQAEAAAHQNTRAIVAELEPKALLAEQVFEAGSDASVKEAAQALARAGVAIGRNRLMRYLREARWVGADGAPYQAQVELGRLNAKISIYDHPVTGEPTLSSTTRITGKGFAELLKRLAPQQQTATILPLPRQGMTA